MKMPHVDEHTIRSAQTPPPHPRSRSHEERTPKHYYQSYENDKRPLGPEMSQQGHPHDIHSPPHWQAHHHCGDPYYYSPYYPPMDESIGSAFHEHPNASATTPPPSPHLHPRFDYSTYDPHYPSGPSIPPYSRRGGGFSYYHSHPNGGPPLPRDMHYAPPHYPPHPADMSPRPPYTGSSYAHHSPPPRYETPPLTPGPTTSYYHDQQYPHFLPPSASMTTTASSRSGTSLTPRDEEEYSYDSPQALGSQEEVNQVGPNDVLCGRGAPTNYHPGNEYFRDLVKQYQSQYLASKRADKPFVASHIVNIIQSRGGRFLRRYKRNGVSWERGHFVWVEVDPQKAYEKACQALREGAPEIRRKMQEADHSDCDDERKTPSPSRVNSKDGVDQASHNEKAKAEQAVEKKANKEQGEEDHGNEEMRDSE